MTLLRCLIEQADATYDITFYFKHQILELDDVALIEIGDDQCRVLIGEDECWECHSDSPSELAGTVLRLVEGYCKTPPSSSCCQQGTVSSTPPTCHGV
jgi:hypothetical protein